MAGFLAFALDLAAAICNKRLKGLVRRCNREMSRTRIVARLGYLDPLSLGGDDIARRVAEALGTDHHEEILNSQAAVALLGTHNMSVVEHISKNRYVQKNGQRSLSTLHTNG